MALEATAPFEAVDVSYARKLVHDAAAYPRSLGRPLDYAAIKVSCSAMSPLTPCEVQFRFGYKRKGWYRADRVATQGCQRLLDPQAAGDNSRQQLISAEIERRIRTLSRESDQRCQEDGLRRGEGL